MAMIRLSLARCAGSPGARRLTAYTTLGFVGYIVAAVVGSILAWHWGLTALERLVVFFVPPLTFLAVVSIATAIVGRERIVFYQATLACVFAVATIGAIARLDTLRLVDITIVMIGIHLVFGRIGCLMVACCHGALGRGITYGPRHVAAGFWHRWSGRSLWPVQLVEAVASGLLVIAALTIESEPGAAAVTYLVGYALVRFPVELLRGDAPRPHLYGLSEAQWCALATCVACALWQANIATVGAALVISTGAVFLIARRRRRELFLPAHLRELDVLMLSLRERQRAETSLGLAASGHLLGDGRKDWVLSSTHDTWNAGAARRLARDLWPRFDLVVGRTPGTVHVVVKLD